MILRIAVWIIHRHYKKYKQAIFYVKGTGKDYPRYLLYTENKDVYRRMEDF